MYICRFCREKQKTTKLKCPECTKASIDGFVHANCKRPYSLDRMVYFYSYSGVVKKVIKKLKYSLAFDLVGDLVKGFRPDLARDILVNRTDIVLVPVPLHKRRQNKRGFNQAQLIARSISKEFGWPMQNLVIRNKFTKPQAEIENREERRTNLVSAFSLGEKRKGDIKSDTLYIIVDDVSTTGATMREICKVLKRNGAGEVWGLAVAG